MSQQQPTTEELVMQRVRERGVAKQQSERALAFARQHWTVPMGATVHLTPDGAYVETVVFISKELLTEPPPNMVTLTTRTLTTSEHLAQHGAMLRRQCCGALCLYSEVTTTCPACTKDLDGYDPRHDFTPTGFGPCRHCGVDMRRAVGSDTCPPVPCCPTTLLGPNSGQCNCSHAVAVHEEAGRCGVLECKCDMYTDSATGRHAL